MTEQDPDLDELTTLLSRCLGRIDEQAGRIDQTTATDGGLLAADLLEHEAATLEQLLAAVLNAADKSDTTDVNAVVDRAVGDFVGELKVPIVLRQQLADQLPQVACPSALFAVAMHRALRIAGARIGAGDELAVATSLNDGLIVVEITGHGNGVEGLTNGRAETLCEFVDGFGGLCRVDNKGEETLRVTLELPRTYATDEL